MNLDMLNPKNDECLRSSRYNMNDEWYRSNAMKM